MSVTGKPRGTRWREDKQRKVVFDVRLSGLHVVWEVVRFNHYFTFISPHIYLFESCPSSVHHHRRRTEECITQSLSDCILCVVRQEAWFFWRAGRQTDRHTYRDEKKNRFGNSIISIPQLCINIMADLCGHSSQGACRELSHSAGVSYIWLEYTHSKQIKPSPRLTQAYQYNRINAHCSESFYFHLFIYFFLWPLQAEETQYTHTSFHVQTR